MEKPSKKSRGYTLPVLFALSIILNYGQYSGWVKIENPVKEYDADGYTQEQREAMILKTSDLGE